MKMISTTSSTTLSPRPPLRGVFVGSGSDGMSDPRIAQLILDMVNEKSSSSSSTSTEVHERRRRRPIQVLYVGTATYDLPCFAQRQTQWFTNAARQSNTTTTTTSTTPNERSTGDDDSVTFDSSSMVSTLDLVHQTPTQEEIRSRIDAADVILVGGGNTLYAVDRWRRLDLVPMLQAAVEERGVVVAGGSAGAICWFDGGHSDSMDPDTYYGPMMQKFGSTNKTDTDMTTMDESSAPSSNGSNKEEDETNKKKDWKYIRVPGLGFLPGLLCPHHDRIQSNGVLRAHDFDNMLLHSHPDEVGVGIDHWAALVVDRAQDSYRVVSLEGKPGSVVYHNKEDNEDGDHRGNDSAKVDHSNSNNENMPSTIATFSADGKGVPGVWWKEVKDGKVVARVLPSCGKLSDILKPAKSIVQDHDALARCRQENPDILLRVEKLDLTNGIGANPAFEIM